MNVDSAGKRNQVIEVERLGKRLLNPTFFEIEGWKRMKFFPIALQQFGFAPDSAELTLEKVDLPISIGNKQIYNAMGWTYQPHNKTFLVWKLTLKLNEYSKNYRTPSMTATLLLQSYQVSQIMKVTLF